MTSSSENQRNDTIAAVATGGVVSAIGILRVSGPDTLGVIGRVFTPAHGAAMSAREDRRLVYGALRDAGGELVDWCLCTLSRAPHSYTGEDTAELQCHGSPMALRLGLECLFAAGARQALPGEFTRRAFLNGRLDLTAAEAVADLIDAETPLAVKNAAGQLGGAIFRRAEGVAAALTDICAHFHAVLDYPDEDIEPFALANYRETLGRAAAELRALLATHARGRLLEKGVKTVLAGKPNAGKSSLLNALLGYERAIVTDIPGTTRDTLSERALVGGVLLRLTDTAGLRESADPLERLGVARTRAESGEAQLLLAVFDLSRPWDAEDDAVLALCAAAPRAIAILNKCDLPERLVPPAALPARACRVSARTGEGLDALAETVKALFPAPVSAAGEILTNARQAEAVSRALEAAERARAALDAGITPDAVLCELEAALAALAELTGRTVREDVVTRIFERFCVGK